MTLLNRYTKYIPYLYFISIIIVWFTNVNRSEGLTAYPILIFGIPFLWQLIKPNRKLNFALGITFMCLTSYMILAYLSTALNFISILENSNNTIIYSGLFVVLNFVMALWIIRNSINKSF